MAMHNTYWFRPGRLERSGRKNPGEAYWIFFLKVIIYIFKEFWLQMTNMNLQFISAGRMELYGTTIANID